MSLSIISCRCKADVGCKLARTECRPCSAFARRHLSLRLPCLSLKRQSRRCASHFIPMFPGQASVYSMNGLSGLHVGGTGAREEIRKEELETCRSQSRAVQSCLLHAQDTGTSCIKNCVGFSWFFRGRRCRCSPGLWVYADVADRAVVNLLCSGQAVA